jgi:two-component system, OmpR family, sensor histidine kinase QseC
MTLAPQRSLQSRLLVMVLGLLTLVWLGAALMTWSDTRHELDELLDGHLAQAASLLMVQQSKADAIDVVKAPSPHKYAADVAFQVFHKGQLVTHSANAQTSPLSSETLGFATVLLADGNEWRVFGTRDDEHDVQVFVGEQIESRDEMVWAVLRNVLVPLVFALPLLAVLLWWAVRQGLAPLRQLSRVLGHRQPQALEPVVLDNMPTEMKPLVDALNALFERITGMLAFERRFTADAAHELRTPIAAIRAQAQVALGAGTDGAQRQHALQATLDGCDRATRLVSQLLTLARLEARQDAATTPFDLSALARSVAADLAPTALARGQSLELEAPAQCTLTGDDVLIAVLVRNLIDNALRYSPDGARVCVQVGAEGRQPVLRVEDSGPGMTEREMARLGERFFRVLGHQQPGSGLGWSIVKRIADVFNAQIQVGRAPLLGGLAVSVRWPEQARV